MVDRNIDIYASCGNEAIPLSRIFLCRKCLSYFVQLTMLASLLIGCNSSSDYQSRQSSQQPSTQKSSSAQSCGASFISLTVTGGDTQLAFSNSYKNEPAEFVFYFPDGTSKDNMDAKLNRSVTLSTNYDTPFSGTYRLELRNQMTGKTICSTSTKLQEPKIGVSKFEPKTSWEYKKGVSLGGTNGGTILELENSGQLPVWLFGLSISVSQGSNSKTFDRDRYYFRASNGNVDYTFAGNNLSYNSVNKKFEVRGLNDDRYKDPIPLYPYSKTNLDIFGDFGIFSEGQYTVDIKATGKNGKTILNSSLQKSLKYQ